MRTPATRILRGLPWVLFPATLLVGGIFFTLRAHPAQHSVNRLSDWTPVSDAKLERTYKTYYTPEERVALDDDTVHSVDTQHLAVRLTMTDEQRRFFRKATKNTPRIPQEVSIGFGDRASRTALLATHGWSTQDTERKSFSVRLFKAQSLADSVRAKRLLLLNMLYDKGAFRIETCYRLLAQIGLFPGYHRYVSLWINGEPQGVYLLVERPEDAIRRIHPNVVTVIRRRWMERPEVKYAAPQIDPTATYSGLQNIDPELSGYALETAIEARLDLDSYMRWLAFNSLVQDADYLDEVCLYQVGETDGAAGPLRVIAWDYDDLFKPPSHPKQAFSDPLLWACEARIDRRIHADPRLTTRYASILNRLLQESMTEAHLTATLAAVRTDLDCIDTGLPAPVVAAQESLRTSEMTLFEARLLERRQELLGRLADRGEDSAPPGER